MAVLPCIPTGLTLSCEIVLLAKQLSLGPDLSQRSLSEGPASGNSTRHQAPASALIRWLLSTSWPCPGLAKEGSEDPIDFLSPWILAVRQLESRACLPVTCRS